MTINWISKISCRERYDLQKAMETFLILPLKSLQSPGRKL
ncbi:unnamed protein product [Heterotrigona itama]|uniref:Uncharacterized protein n=1 Tax=Heterotrigona itama TaxID=395501 RepID=A0A6V7H7Y4_9HYME|nr:unnamed protein product [Heterotrigona itama]